MKRTIEKIWGNRDEMLKAWRVDTENGIVYSRRTGESIGVLHKRGYVLIAKRANGKIYLIKRSNIIWWSKHQKMPSAKMCIDHIDGDKTNDRIENTKGSSKYIGVIFVKNKKKFRVQIKKYGKYYYFGYHENEKDAAIARDRGMIELYAKEMRETGFLPPLNFPEILQNNKELVQLELF